MRRALNITLYGIAALVVLAISVVILANKPIPKGEQGERAEALADSMLAAVNVAAWESLRYVKWTFRGDHHYVWDKWYDLAEIRFEDKRVLINVHTLQGRAWVGDKQLMDREKRRLLQIAWEFWCNDSFWLNPIVKIRDDGTERSIVDLENGDVGLLVTYTQGGATPGDSFLWTCGEDGLPTTWQMWASSLPVKGLSVTWENWKEMDGAKVAQSHRIGPFDIKLTNIGSGDHHSELGLENDPFLDF